MFIAHTRSAGLQVSQLWKEVVTRVAADYPEVELSHMYIGGCRMLALGWAPKLARQAAGTPCWRSPAGARAGGQLGAHRA